MIAKVLSVIFMAALLVILGFFGVAICRDFCVWYDGQWAFGVIADVHKSARELESERDPGIARTLSNRTYRIRFNGYEKKQTVSESVDYKKGDSIRVLYSPRCPKNFKLKIPSIRWIGAWAVIFVVAAPVILYFGFVFLAGYLRGRF